VAGVDAAGAAMGSIGLVACAFRVRKALTMYPAWLPLTVALLVWAVVSFLVWRIHKAT